APQGKDIKITHDPADIAQCQSKGSVTSHPPYLLPGDDYKQLKNRVVSENMDADTILITSRVVVTKGIAYRCKA
ncbi:MAG TPA: hypothetical protein VGM97_04235, partial [Steroidobacteraceae bacterium]